MSLLVLGEVLGVYVNTLTANAKYLVQVCENLQLPIEMELSQKRKCFSEFFVPFLEPTSNFEHLKMKMIFIANVFLKLETLKILVKPLSKRCRSRTRFESQHVNASQILVISL